MPRKKAMRVVIIGIWDSAFDQACSLAERSANVVALVGASKPKAFESLVREAKDLGVEIIFNASVLRVKKQHTKISIYLCGGNLPVDANYF
ncbi:MAG: NAD-binding protein [Desulfomonilaceae bacterium]